MKKRLVCLFLILIMVIPMLLTGCGTEDEDDAMQDIEDEASESAKTLSMWVVTEEKMYDENGELTEAGEAAKLVNSKLTAITESKFKTRLVITYLTESEYREKLEETIAAYEETKKQEAATETETETEEGAEEVTEDETETDALGMTTIKYPELRDNQVDIVYIAGDDMYFDFIDQGWLAPLDASLNGASKKISEYVSATLLSAAKHNGVTYAIPNNHAIGNYTYMLIDKAMMQKCAHQGYIQANQIDGFFNKNLFSFLSLADKVDTADEYVTIDATYEYCLDLLAHYWSIDPATYGMLEDFSVFGYHYKNIEELNRGSVVLGFNSLFENADFVNDYLKLNQFKFDGYFGDAKAENKKAAVKFVTGNAATLKQYENDYYSVVVGYPTASSHDIYGNMFGVYSKSIDVDRSMEVITYLNTNKDFRNLLQYGVEDTHYTLDKDEQGNTVIKIDKDCPYQMNIEATGNEFIAYPDPSMSADIWETGKAQNRDSVVAPLLNFDLKGHAATTAPEPEEESIGSKGYNLSYSSGYSKDVLSQNSAIGKWLEESDAAGKGVYVLQTSLVDGANVTYLYYVYNNTIEGNVDFSVAKEILEGEGEDAVEGDNFILSYTEATGASEEDYELSIVRVLTKKSTNVGLVVGEEKTAPTVKALNTYINFDIFNTTEYTVETYKGLSKVEVLRNEAIMTWLDECDKDKSKSATSYILTYTSPEKDGKVEKTFVLYRTGLKLITNLTVQPTGSSGELTLNFNYTDDTEYPLFKDEPKYVLHYVRVTVDADAKVDYVVTSNGTKDKSVNSKTAAEDPDFVMLGMLDTELVKFMHELNAKLVEKLNACGDMDELKALIAELKVLLSTGEEVPAASSFVLLKDLVNEYVGKDNTLKDFHRLIQCITSTAEVPIMVPDEDTTDPDDLIEGEYEDSVGNVESYIYYQSPYAIYYNWLNTYGYLPKK